MHPGGDEASAQPSDSGIPAAIEPAPSVTSSPAAQVASPPPIAQDLYVVAQVVDWQPDGAAVAIATRRIVEPAAPSVTTSDPLTDGELTFLAGLTREQRAMFDAKSPAKRRAMLVPHAAGFDRIIAEHQKSMELSPPKPINSAAKSQPALTAMPTAELIGRVRELDPHGVQAVAERLVTEFGGAQNNRYWTGFHMLMMAAWRGAVDAGAVRFAYERATNRKRKITKRGAYFWTAVRDQTGIKPEDLKRLAYGWEF